MEHYFKDKKILLCLTGSIAIYKSLFLLSELKKLGVHVKVIMTESAKTFIGESLIEGLLGEKPVSDLFENALAHINLAKWADLILIAPATANVIAKTRIGLADDLLSAVLLATTVPIVMVPAMNQAMWHHPATQESIAVLIQRDVTFLGPDSGMQACGDVGLGRMLEVENLIKNLPKFFCKPILNGRTILITAGPTAEPIDPVRVLTNRSSGKMGYALAQSAFYHGAKVTLVSGKTSLIPPEGVEYYEVETADEMFKKVQECISNHDTFIAVAAVSDFKPVNTKEQKIKKQNSFTLELIKTEDILAKTASQKIRPICIGFAAETENLIQNAQLKLKQKNLDMIIANIVSETEGFNREENSITILTSEKTLEFRKLKKEVCADLIVQEISRLP